MDRRGSIILLTPLLFLSIFVGAEPLFDVSGNHTKRAFLQFVDDMRARLRVPDRPYVMMDAGRLPAQQDVPTNFEDLRLRAGDYATTLRMRADNVFVIGFRTGIDEGTWYETMHDGALRDVTLIDGSTPLGFDGSYRTVGVGEVTPDTEIGRHVVETAIMTLATYDGRNWGQRALADALRTLIVNFVESIRLNPVATRVANVMDADDEGQSPSGSQDNPGTLGMTEHLIHSWSKLSTALYVAANDVDQYSDQLAERFREFHSYGIHNAFEAAQALGLALLKNQEHRRRPRRSTDNEDHVVAGITLVEVIEVIVTSIDDEDPGDLYGEISIEDSNGAQPVFSRDRSDSQSVRPGEPAELTGPGRAVSGFDDFAIYVNLMDEDVLLSPDDEVSKGEVLWNSYEATSDEYDVVRRETVYGEHGRVEVSFAVMTDAAVATVEVVLLDSSEDTPDVYGVILSKTSLDDDTAVTTKLLGRSDTQRVGVDKGSAVPLQRKVVAVPLTSVLGLQITVNLWDRNLVFADQQIAYGSVAFQPKLAGEDSAEVAGDNGRVAVRVTWSTWFE